MDSRRRGNDEWGAGMMNWPAGDGLPGRRPKAPTRGAPTEIWPCVGRSERGREVISASWGKFPTWFPVRRSPPLLPSDPTWL